MNLNAIDPMCYLPDMEQIQSDILEKVLRRTEAYQYQDYTTADVQRALAKDNCSIDDFAALLSPAAAAVFGTDGAKSPAGDKKTLWYLRLLIYAIVYCQLL